MDIWSPIGGTVWEVLGGAVLLEEICVTVSRGSGSEVLWPHPPLLCSLWAHRTRSLSQLPASAALPPATVSCHGGLTVVALLGCHLDYIWD